MPNLKIGEIFDRWSDDYEIAIRKKIPQYNELQKVFFSLLHFRVDEKIDVLDLGVGSGEMRESVCSDIPMQGSLGLTSLTR